jgi:opacity protein-like surface antigen
MAWPGASKGDAGMVATGFVRATRGMLIASLLFSTLSVVTARAEEERDYSYSGAYVGLGLAQGVDMALEDALEENRSYLDSDATVGSGTGFDLQLGYRVNPHLAMELQFEYVFSFKTEIKTGIETVDGGGNITIVPLLTHDEHDVMVVTGNVKAPLLRGQVQPFLLAGGGLFYYRHKSGGGFRSGDGSSLYPSLSDTAMGFGLRLGAGLDLYLVEHVLLNAGVSYVLPFGDVEDLDYISVALGVQYRF